MPRKAAESAPEALLIPDENYPQMAQAIVDNPQAANWLIGIKLGSKLAGKDIEDWKLVITGVELRPPA